MRYHGAPFHTANPDKMCKKPWNKFIVGGAVRKLMGFSTSGFWEFLKICLTILFTALSKITKLGLCQTLSTSSGGFKLCKYSSGCMGKLSRDAPIGPFLTDSDFSVFWSYWSSGVIWRLPSDFPENLKKGKTLPQVS